MSHKHIKKIEKVFEHPVATDLDSRKLVAALEHFGCSVEQTKSNKLKISYDDKEFVLGLHHSGNLSKDEVVGLRHYLEEIGLTPAKLA
ncbi:MAG: hypothetical protein WBK95_01425 [Sulfurimonas sp.]|nr:hypothetical protein [Sulfurimonas sp.]MDD3060817.1 hypothetical protein [Sulfurimonas sp.]MDD5202743.1 hypothetical protein [Sulfurimonas sp.]